MLRHRSKCQNNQQLYAPRKQMNISWLQSFHFLAPVLRAEFRKVWTNCRRMLCVELMAFSETRLLHEPWRQCWMEAGEGSWWLFFGAGPSGGIWPRWDICVPSRAVDGRLAAFPTLQRCLTLPKSTIVSLPQKIGKVGQNLYHLPTNNFPVMMAVIFLYSASFSTPWSKQ